MKAHKSWTEIGWHSWSLGKQTQSGKAGRGQSEAAASPRSQIHPIQHPCCPSEVRTSASPGGLPPRISSSPRPLHGAPHPPQPLQTWDEGCPTPALTICSAMPAATPPAMLKAAGKLSSPAPRAAFTTMNTAPSADVAPAPFPWFSSLFGTASTLGLCRSLARSPASALHSQSL